MKNFFLIPAAVLAASFSLNAAEPAPRPGTNEQEQSMTITGSITAYADPDYYELRIPIVSKYYQDPTEAANANAALADKIHTALKVYSFKGTRVDDPLTASGPSTSWHVESIYNGVKTETHEGWMTTNTICLRIPNEHKDKVTEAESVVVNLLPKKVVTFDPQITASVTDLIVLSAESRADVDLNNFDKAAEQAEKYLAKATARYHLTNPKVTDITPVVSGGSVYNSGDMYARAALQSAPAGGGGGQSSAPFNPGKIPVQVSVQLKFSYQGGSVKLPTPLPTTRKSDG